MEMKLFRLFFVLTSSIIVAQNIRGVQLFNPQTNDETSVINAEEKLILKFDDLTNSSQIYRYTLKHYDRNWQDDGLFFTEYANGSLNGLVDTFEYSFNTYQKYTHYELTFPNDKMKPKISGNFALIVYKDTVDKPIVTKRFSVVESSVEVSLNISRYSDSRKPNNNQRVEVQVIGNGQNITSNVNSMSLNVIQNNNYNFGVFNEKPTSTLGNQLLFQQMSLIFPGNNEFYYFDNKNIDIAADMVAGTENLNGENHTYLHPVWAYPLNYQYQPDVDGAFYFRRNDNGTERDASKEGDYSWVYFYLDSEKISKDLYILGGFNDFVPDKESLMHYDENSKKYVAKIYLKQGFYNYIIATKNSENELLNFGEINGSFWQTENLYQAFIYYTPFGKNYDGLLGYGEYRTVVNR